MSDSKPKKRNAETDSLLPIPGQDISTEEATQRLNQEFNSLDVVRQGIQMMGPKKFISPKVTYLKFNSYAGFQKATKCYSKTSHRQTKGA